MPAGITIRQRGARGKAIRGKPEPVTRPERVGGDLSASDPNRPEHGKGGPQGPPGTRDSRRGRGNRPEGAAQPTTDGGDFLERTGAGRSRKAVPPSRRGNLLSWHGTGGEQLRRD